MAIPGIFRRLVCRWLQILRVNDRGIIKTLRLSEMLEQIYEIKRITGERVSNNIVVMGTGEPLDNYENLVRFLWLISSEKGMNISQRNITVSTCGIVPKIYELAKERLQITLALSLHAPNDEKGCALFDADRQQVFHERSLEACHHYFDETGRRISFEYALVEGRMTGRGRKRAL